MPSRRLRSRATLKCATSSERSFPLQVRGTSGALRRRERWFAGSDQVRRSVRELREAAPIGTAVRVGPKPATDRGSPAEEVSSGLSDTGTCVMAPRHPARRRKRVPT
jgi:hypothetical protein